VQSRDIQNLIIHSALNLTWSLPSSDDGASFRLFKDIVLRRISFIAFFPYFEKVEGGLWDHLAVYVNPLLILDAYEITFPSVCLYNLSLIV
jgi:hypothetical protein